MSTNETLTLDFVEGLVPLKIVIISIYGALSTGIILNCAVAGTIVHIFRKLKEGLSDKHMFLYILALSFVDTLVLANVPLIIVDIIMNGEWIFGNILCKIHWTTDSVNKILSTFILTMVSFDRYLAICHPFRMKCWRSVRTTILALLFCTVFSICLLSPCYLHAEVRSITYARLNITFSKCSYRWNQKSDMLYIYSLFIIGYCIPFILLTFFHMSILKTLKLNSQRLQRSRRRRRSSTAVQDVGRRMIFVTIFYFICWTPYWLQTFFIQHTSSKPHDEEEEEEINWRPTLFLAVHFLVYTNSAINPLIYGIFNLEIRRQRIKALAKKRRRSSALVVECNDKNDVW